MRYISAMTGLSKRSLLLFALAACLWRADARADAPFDYYVLALSWAPSWCRLEGDARDAATCDPSADAGFTLHGLWPQFEKGYPEFCRSSQRDPSRRETAEVADLFGSSGYAWYQWKKHGRCAGLDPADFYDAAREAVSRVRQPGILARIGREISLAPGVIEEAFLEDNPDLDADGITITCRHGHIMEARICLTPELDFRDCAPDIRRDCTSASAIFPPIR